MRVCVCVCVFVNVMHLFLLLEQWTSFLLQCFFTHLADSITCFRSNALQHNGRCVSTLLYDRCPELVLGSQLSYDSMTTSKRQHFARRIGALALAG